MRCAQTGALPTASARPRPNGNAPAATSSSVTACRTSRACGPHIPITQSSSVSSRSSTCASPSRRCSRSQPRSESIAAAPVTTRKRCSAEARDGDVGHDAAALVQELRVDDGPGLAIDVRVADALEQRGGARALDRDLAERRHVDQARRARAAPRTPRRAGRRRAARPSRRRAAPPPPCRHGRPGSQ